MTADPTAGPAPAPATGPAPAPATEPFCPPPAGPAPGSTVAPAGRQGWWTRFRAWLARVLAALRAAFAPLEDVPPPEPVEVPAGPISQRRALSQPIIVPARGFVFTVQIYVWITWHADSMTDDLLDSWSQHFTPRARRDLARDAADLARHFHPHQAAELEINLNRRLGSSFRTYARSGMVLRARPDFRVRLDDEVKAQLRPAYLQRLKMESEHEVALRRAQMLDQLTHRWVTVIERLRRSPLSAAAARLTDDMLARILDQLVVDERAGVDLLAQRLRDAIHGSNRVGQPLEPHEADEIIDLLNEALRGEADPWSTAGSSATRSPAGAGVRSPAGGNGRPRSAP